MNILETKNLTKNYGKSRGIKDVNLSIEEGDMFGFIGPNGAGKSTTIRLLLGLIHPTSGEASIFGKDCFRDLTEILAEVGYMPSEIQFYGQLRVEEVLRLSAKLHKKNCDVYCKTLCGRFQLDTSKRMDTLSLGNRKKVSIICAIQHNPRLIVLDEPTSGLDPLMQREFFEVLEENNDKGSTIFFSSHVLPEIQKHCKNAAIIREGKLVKTAPVNELSATSAKVVTLQCCEKKLEQRIQNSLTDVKNLVWQEDGITFLYGGDMGALIHFLDACVREEKLYRDVTITEPSLEEIFMHYYE